MPGTDAILITGGYGEVGHRLAARLATEYPDRVVGAGRDGRKAAALAGSLERGVRSLALDIGDPVAIESALNGVTLVVNCVDQREPHLLRAAVEHGLAYTDVSPSLIWRAALTMRSRAQQSGARIVMGAGLSPGISSVMARAAAERIGRIDTLHMSLLLSVGDAFGPASLEYLMSEISAPFVVVEDGRERRVRSFTEPRYVQFPEPIGRRLAYRAPFADQFFFPETLGVRTAAARLALDPSWITKLVAALVRTRVTVLLKSAAVRRAMMRSVHALHGRHAGRDQFGIVVEGRGPSGTVQLSLMGHNQAEGTAIGTALIVRALYDGEVSQAGVWYPEHVIASAPFFDSLGRHGLKVMTTETMAAR